MRDVGYRAAEEYGVQFYYQDFRPMFRDGQQRARELGFYMQKYCGCIFSEQERYQKPSRIIPESHARPSRTERGGRALFAEICNRYEFAKISACNFDCISQKFCRIQKKRLHNSKIILAFHADIVYNAGNGMQEGVDP